MSKSWASFYILSMRMQIHAYKLLSIQPVICQAAPAENPPVPPLHAHMTVGHPFAGKNAQGRWSCFATMSQKASAPSTHPCMHVWAAFLYAWVSRRRRSLLRGPFSKQHEPTSPPWDGGGSFLIVFIFLLIVCFYLLYYFVMLYFKFCKLPWDSLVGSIHLAEQVYHFRAEKGWV